MAVEHMAAENNKPTAIKTKTDEYVLKLFWTLSEGQDNARIKASNELVKHLTKKQENSEESKTDELCPTLVYTLERLIKGLSSGRKWSRLGFSLALTQILRNLDVPVKQVLDLTEKHLHFSSHDQKQECGGLMLGQAFVYLSLIQSHRLIKGDGKEYGGEVIKTLLKLCKEKMYLQSICSQGVTLLIQQASSKIFKKRLLPCLQDELIKGWKGCTINRLLIALVSTIHHEDCMEEILEEHWTNPIVSKKSFTFIVEVLRNCSVESKVYLQVCELLAKLSETSVDTTWHGVGARILEGNQQQKQIAGCLLNKLLIVSSSPEQIEELLNRKVREFLILFPGSILVKQSKDEILKTIVDKIRSCQDVDIEMALVRSLLRDPGGPAIDRSTRSQTLSQAIKSLSEEGFDQYFKMVQQIFMEEKVEGFTPTECFRIKKKAVFLLRQKTLIGEHQTALIKQLFVQGYFNIVTPSTKISYCVNKVSYDEEELKMIQNGYLNCVANFHSGSMVQSTHRKKYLQLLIDVFNYAQELMSNTKIVTTKKKLSPKERDAWNKVVVVVKEITDKAEEKKKVEDDAFLFLFIHFALQILTDSIKLDLSLLEDVQSCYKKVFLKKKTGDKNTSDEPEWIEVMTEVLLNMMSHSYQLARVMSSTAFKLLVDHVTPEAVEQIITVMFSKMGDDAVNFIDDEYKDDDDDDDDVEDDSGDDEGDDDSDEESSEETDEDLEDTKPNGKKVEKSSKQKKLKTDGKDSKEKSVKSEKVVKKKRGKQEDDDDEMEEAEDFNEGFRQTVKAALGVAAADSDDEGSDSDLNDSDMEKMDDKLAEAFRSMRKSSRKKAGVEAEKQFLAFRTRVVDLIQILVKSDIQAQIAVILVLPLLRIMDKSNSKEGQRELHVKTKKSFDILYNQKHMKGASEVDKDWLFKTLQEIVQFSKKATDMVLVKEISNACLYIMKLLLLDDETLNPTKRDDTKPKKKKSENYTEKVVDFLKQNLSFFLYNKKEYRFHPGFFNNMLEKFPKLFWFLNVTLLDVLQNERIKVYNKTLACGYMSTLLVKKPCLELKSEEWQKFEDAILPALKKFILSFDVKDNYKPKFLQEIFNILFKMIQISPQVKTKITDDIREKISSLKPKFCKNTRQAFNRYKGVLDEGVGKRSRRQERHSSQDHKPKSVEKINGDTLHVNGDHEAEKIGTATPKSSKKSKKKQKERTDSETDKQNENEDDTQVSKMDVEEENNKTEVKKLSKKKRKSDEFALNGELSPSSEKKTKLSKSFNFGVDDGDSTSKKLNKKERKRKISL